MGVYTLGRPINYTELQALEQRRVYVSGDSPVTGQLAIWADANHISGSTIDTIETTLTDDDTHIPTSGAVMQALTGGSVFHTAEIILSAEDILNNIGGVILPAPGIGRCVMIHYMIAILRAGSIPFSGGSVPGIFISIGNSALMVLSDLVDYFNSDHDLVMLRMVSAVDPSDLTLYENQPINCEVGSGSLTEGNGSIKIIVYYTIFIK